MNRKTKETEVSVKLELNGSGKSQIATGIGFFDHMLELFAFHSCFDLDVTCKGDLHVCGHHTVEDVGIVLGKTFRQKLDPEKNFRRYGVAIIPMDECLAQAVVDISGRALLVFKADFGRERVGDFDTELVREFFQAFVRHGEITLHLHLLYGENAHHQIEALFKATAVALRQALETDPRRTGPVSTKGTL